MLTVLRMVLLALATCVKAFGCGRALVGAGLGGGCMATEGARKPLFGVPGIILAGLDGMFPVLFRVLVTGNAGSAIFGGPSEGRDGRGSVVVMTAD